jgi:hypothetical protein
VGNSTVYSNVTGAAITTNGTITVQGAATLSNTIAVTGATTLSNSIAFTVNATFSKTIAVTGAGSSYVVTASGCGVGTFRLTLLANSISGIVAGPTADSVTSDVVIERTPPTVTVTFPASLTNAATLDYGLTFSESVTGLTASDFTISGSACEVSTVSGLVTRYTVQVTRCADGANVLLAMQANSVSDAATNLGPVVAPILQPLP